MKQKSIQSFLVSIILISEIACTSQNWRYTQERDANIPSELISNLPEKLKSDSFDLRFNLTPLNDQFTSSPVFIYLKHAIASEAELRQLSDSAIANYSISDTCNLVLNRFQNGIIKSRVARIQKDYEDWYSDLADCGDIHPVPNYQHIESVLHSEIAKPSRFLVLESKKGKIFHEKYYEGSFPMPDNWRHGFSKGYIVDDSSMIAIFWLIIW